MKPYSGFQEPTSSCFVFFFSFQIAALGTQTPVIQHFSTASVPGNLGG